MTGGRHSGLARPARWRRSRRAPCRARAAWAADAGRGSWVVFLLGVAYFLLPLLATLLFSLEPQPFGPAYENVLVRRSAVRLEPDLLGHRRDPHDHHQHPDHRADRVLGPAAAAAAAPVVEFVTLLPFVIPPIVLSSG